MTIRNLTLLMIVKNESAQIERCLKSCVNFIDRWLIIDTGSTDDTVEKIEKCLSGKPGKVMKRPWVNFGFNRNQLLEQYEIEYGLSDEDFALLMDADQVLELSDRDFRKKIGPESQFLVKVKTPETYEFFMPYLVRMNERHKYIGSTHEALLHSEMGPRVHFDGFHFYHHQDGGARADKYLRDQKLLEQELAEEPNNARAHFYLGQTMHNLGDLERTLAEYELAAQKTNWSEERYISRLRRAHILSNLGKTDSAILEYMRAIEISPHRSEAYYYLGKILNSLKLYYPAESLMARATELQPTSDVLFVERWIEQYGLKLEHAVSLWWIGKRTEAKEVFLDLKKLKGLPEAIVTTLDSNLALYK